MITKLIKQIEDLETFKCDLRLQVVWISCFEYCFISNQMNKRIQNVVALLKKKLDKIEFSYYILIETNTSNPQSTPIIDTD